MEPKGARFPLPIKLVILDAVGSVMVGLGLLGWFAGTEIPALAFLQLDEYAWQYVLGGLLLMIPMVVHVIRNRRP